LRRFQNGHSALTRRNGLSLVPPVVRHHSSASRRDLIEGQQIQAGGGQLDRQRNAIQTLAKLGDHSNIRVGDDKGGGSHSGAVDEEPGRFPLEQRLDGNGLRPFV
jgi:hypothetical protein